MASNVKNIISILVVALVTIVVNADATGRCNTGPIQCCSQLMKSGSPQALQLLTKNGIGLGVLAGVTGSVGANCSPITLVGVGSGSQCSGQTACCEKSNFNGLVAVGCSPINIHP